MRAIERAQAACGTSHARPKPSDIAIQMQDEVAPAAASTAEARTPQLRSLSFQNFETPAAKPASRPFFVNV